MALLDNTEYTCEGGTPRGGEVPTLRTGVCHGALGGNNSVSFDRPS